MHQMIQRAISMKLFPEQLLCAPSIRAFRRILQMSESHASDQPQLETGIRTFTKQEVQRVKKFFEGQPKSDIRL